MVGDNQEEVIPEPTEFVLCVMADESLKVGVVCGDCYCIVKYEGICHNCPENIEYQNPAELVEQAEFLCGLVSILPL